MCWEVQCTPTCSMGTRGLSLAYVDPSLIGRKVCTKAVGGNVAHQDITLDYKGDHTLGNNVACNSMNQIIFSVKH